MPSSPATKKVGARLSPGAHRIQSRLCLNAQLVEAMRPRRSPPLTTTTSAGDRTIEPSHCSAPHQTRSLAAAEGTNLPPHSQGRRPGILYSGETPLPEAICEIIVLSYENILFCSNETYRESNLTSSVKESHHNSLSTHIPL
jgi:hypothetical protein